MQFWVNIPNMAEGLNTEGNGLFFQAGIDDANFLKGIDSMLNASRKLHDTEMKRFELQVAGQREANQMLASSGSFYESLGNEVKQSLGALSAHQKEMQRIAQEKAKLNTAYATGNASQAAYTAGITALVAEELELANTIAKVSAEITKSDSFQKAGTAAIAQKKTQIEQLATAYEKLDGAGKGSDTGKAIQTNIAGLKQDIEGLDKAFQSINQNAFGNLANEVKQLNQVEAKYVQIAKLQNDLAKVQNQKQELNQDFTTNQQKAQEYRQELTKLNEQEVLLKSSIDAAKASLKASDTQYDASQGKIRAEIKELDKLHAAYAALNATEVKTPAGNKLQTDISRLEKTVKAGQDAETKVLEERAAAAAKLEQQYKELNAVKVQKQELKNNFADGGKYITQYRAELEKLNATEKELTETINRETVAAQQNEAISKSVAAAIGTRIAEIRKLEQAYDALSNVDQADPQIGGKLKADMDGLQKQIRIIQGMFIDLSSDGGNALMQKAQAIREQFAAIAKLEFDNSGMVNSLTALQKETAGIKADLANMPAFTLEGIEQSTQQLKQLQTTYDALNDEEKLSIVGRETLTQIQGIEAELKTVDNILSNLPKLTLGEIDSKKAQVMALNLELAKLNDTERVDINLGGAIQAQISTLNGEINKLEANVRDLPTISLGDLQSQIRNLKTLTATFDRLSEADKINPEIGGKMKGQIQELTANLDKFKAGLKDIPTLTISGIEERVSQIAALQKQLNALPENQKLTLGVTIEANINKLTSEVDELKKTLGTVPELQLGQVAENTAKVIQLQDATADLKKELTNFADVEISMDALPEAIKDLEKLKNKLDSLPDGKNVELLFNIEGLEEEIADLKTSLTDLPDISIGGVETTTDKITSLENEATKLKEQLAGLSTSAKIDLAITGPIQQQIDEIENELAGLKAEVDLQVSVGNLDQLTTELKDLEQQFNNLSRAQQQEPQFGGKLLQDIAKIEDELDQLGAKLKAAPELKIGSINERKAEIQQLAAAIDNLPEIDLKDPKIGGAMVQELRVLEKELDELNAKIKATPEFKLGSIAGKTAELSRLKQEYAEISAIDRRNATVGVQMKKNIQELEKEVKDLNNEFSETETFARKALVAAGAYLSISAGTDLFKEIKNVRGEFEQLEISLTTILGSKAEANKLLAQVTDLAAKSPYDLKEIGQGAKSLIAYGTAAEDAVKTLEMIGNVASGVSIPITELVQTYGKLRTQGRAYQEDINEFTGRGIPIIKELAKQFGVAESEVKNLVEAGKVGFPEVQKAFENMTGPGGQFNNLMAEQAKGIVGLTSGLTDAFDRMFNDIGKANEGIIKQGLAGTIELVDNYQQVLDILGLVVVGYGSYRAALVAEAAIKQIVAARTVGMTAAEILHAQALTISTVAQRAYVAALAAAPVAAFTAVIAGLGIALYSLSQATSAAEASQERFARISEEGDLAANKEKQRINELVTVLKSETATREQKAATVKKLRDSTGELLQGYSDEEIAAGKAANAIKKYIAELEKKAEVKVAFDELEKLNEQLGLLEVKGLKAISFLDRMAQSLKNTFAPSGLSFSDYVKGLFSGDAANKKIVDQQKASIKKQADDLKKEYGKSFEGLVSGVTGGAKGANVNDAFADLIKDVDGNFQKLLDLAKNRQQLENIQKAVQEKINSLAPGSKDIAGLQAKLKQVGKVLEQYDLKNDTKALKKSNDERLRFLEELSKKEAEIRRKGLTQDEAQLAEARERYELMRKEAAKLKLGTAVVTRINRLEKEETGNIRYDQDTEKLQKELNKQREIYANYESFKTAVGKEQADERFANEKAAFENFGALLESELGKITALNIPVADMTEPMRKRFLALTAMQKEYNQSQREELDSLFIEAFQKTVSFEEERLEIQKRYAKQAASLVQANPINLQARLEELEKMEALEIDAAKDAAFQKTAIYKQLSQDIIQFTKDEIRARIEATKAALENDKLPAELRKRLQAKLGDLEIKLRLNVNDNYITSLEKQKKLIKEALKNHNLTAAAIEEQVQNLQQVNAELQKAKGAKLQELADDVGGLAGSMKEAAGYMAQFDEGAGKAVNKLADMAGNVAGVISGFASGNPFAVISGAIGLLNGFTDLMDQSDEKREANEKRQQQSLEGTKRILSEMSRLLEQQAGIIARALGVDKLDAYNKQLQLISKDIVDTIKKINSIQLTVKNPNGRGITTYTLALANLLDTITTGGTRPRGTDTGGGVISTLKTLEEVIEANRQKIDGFYKMLQNPDVSGNIEELRELIKTYEDLGAKLEEYKNKLREVVTGSTYSGIVDSIADGFRKGMSSAEIFAQNFEDLMKNAIIESLKLQALELPLKKFFEQFASDAENGLDDSEVQNLADIYKQILKDAEEKFKALQQIAGVDFKTDASKANKNNLGGGFQGLSTAQADLLASQFGGVRLVGIEQLDVQKQILAAILAPGSINLPAAGANTLSIPGILEVAENGRITVGYTNEIRINGTRQVELMTMHLDYARQTADNTGETAVNTRRLQGIETAVKDLARISQQNANALRANNG